MNSSLTHYGIKGMKWGHRSRQERRVDKYQKKLDSATENFKRRSNAYKTGNNGFVSSTKLLRARNTKDNAARDLKEVKDGKLITTTQKKNAVVVAALAGTKLTSILSDEKKRKRLSNTIKTSMIFTTEAIKYSKQRKAFIKQQNMAFSDAMGLTSTKIVETFFDSSSNTFKTYG